MYAHTQHPSHLIPLPSLRLPPSLPPSHPTSSCSCFPVRAGGRARLPRPPLPSTSQRHKQELTELLPPVNTDSLSSFFAFFSSSPPGCLSFWLVDCVLTSFFGGAGGRWATFHDCVLAPLCENLPRLLGEMLSWRDNFHRAASCSVTSCCPPCDPRGCSAAPVRCQSQTAGDLIRT